MADISFVKHLDPVIDASRPKEYVIEKSGIKSSYVPYKSQSTGNNALAFNVIPPSRSVFVDRKMFVETDVSIMFSATVGANKTVDGGSLVTALQDAPRNFGLAKCAGSIQLQVGSANVSMQSEDVITELLHCMPLSDFEYSSGIVAQDRSQTYECYVDNTSGQNVLGTVDTGILKAGELPRGIHKIDVSPLQMVDSTGNLVPVPSTAPTTAYVVKQLVTYHIYETVALSPLLWGKMNHAGIIGVNAMTLQINFSNLERMWSGTRPVDSVGAELDVALDVVLGDYASRMANSQLWVHYISPSTSDLLRIPKQVDYNYYEIQRFLNNGYTALKYGDSTTVISQNLQLKTIPSLIICGIRRVKGHAKYYHTDSYYQIKKASINFNNNVGILSSASQYALYEVSRKNGLENVDWASWVGEYGGLSNGTKTGKEIPSGLGSLLVLKPSDFGLSDAEAAGISNSTYNFQIQLDIKDINPAHTVATADYELFVIAVNDGIMSIDYEGTGQVTTKIGVVSEADVLKAEVVHPEREVEGGFLGNWVKKAANIVHKVAEYAPKVSNTLKTVGLGHAAGLYGETVIGGAVASKRSLKDRLK